MAILGSLVGDIVGDFIEYSVGLDDVHVAGAGFVGCRLDILDGLGLVIIFSRLCRCRVRGVSGWLVQISTFLFGFRLLAGVVGVARMFRVGCVGWVFLSYFVVFCIPRSFVCISCSFPFTLTNSFQTLGLVFTLFLVGLGLALLVWLEVWFWLFCLGLVVCNIF